MLVSNITNIFPYLLIKFYFRIYIWYLHGPKVKTIYKGNFKEAYFQPHPFYSVPSTHYIIFINSGLSFPCYFFIKISKRIKLFLFVLFLMQKIAHSLLFQVFKFFHIRYPSNVSILVCRDLHYFFITIWYIIICGYFNLFNRPFMDGNLDYFQYLTIANNVTINNPDKYFFFLKFSYHSQKPTGGYEVCFSLL